MSTACPFCEPVRERLIFEAGEVLALWDAFPVSPGHALLVPRRHVAGWFDATPSERVALVEGIDHVRQEILRRFQPDGFNLGVNVGQAAGQTVFHLHLHVIPRYRGDVPNPRGGVRYVIPQKADYSASAGSAINLVSNAPHDRPLITGDSDPLLPHLLADLDRAVCVDIAVAFVLRSGVRLIQEHLRDLLMRGGRIRIVTGDYLNVTEPEAIRELLDLEGSIDLRAFEANEISFHPKAFIFRRADGFGTAYVGSSNLTQTALDAGLEWNYRILTSADKGGFDEIERAFSALYQHPRTRHVDEAWLREYQLRRPFVLSSAAAIAGTAKQPVELPPAPHPVQVEALTKLRETRRVGNKAGLVVLATGLGKTWLSAFDSDQAEFRRVLFVAHREEILSQAMATFRRVRPNASFGRYAGGDLQPDADIVFASVMTLGRSRHLEQFDRDAFDYIIVDEFHHAAARTYRNLISHFTPKFLLGLTATPERTDGGDLLSLCQENLVYRCDIVEGIERGLLCPSVTLEYRTKLTMPKSLGGTVDLTRRC